MINEATIKIYLKQLVELDGEYLRHYEGIDWTT
jgi:hypothetical protein